MRFIPFFIIAYIVDYKLEIIFGCFPILYKSVDVHCSFCYWAYNIGNYRKCLWVFFCKFYNESYSVYFS